MRAGVGSQCYAALVLQGFFVSKHLFVARPFILYPKERGARTNFAMRGGFDAVVFFMLVASCATVAYSVVPVNAFNIQFSADKTVRRERQLVGLNSPFILRASPHSQYFGMYLAFAVVCLLPVILFCQTLPEFLRMDWIVFRAPLQQQLCVCTMGFPLG